MRTNQEYKNEALAALKGKWAPSVVATIVLFVMVFAVVIPVAVIEALANPDAGSMSMGALLAIYGFTLLIYYPLSMVGYYNAFKVLHQTGDDKVTSNTSHSSKSTRLFNTLKRFSFAKSVVGLARRLRGGFIALPLNLPLIIRILPV